MLEWRIPVDHALAAALEDWFCEDVQPHWLLDEHWQTGAHTLRGFFADAGLAAAELARLRARFPAVGEPAEARELADRDWQEAYKIHFKPWHERGLHWVPVWESAQYPLPPGEQMVVLDPGMAFGTGNHETTRLCARRLLDARDAWHGAGLARRSVIDAGCGSGILAISAAKLGFGTVRGFDLDPDSVRISIENEQLCGLAGRIEWSWAGLADGLAGDSADLLMANILADVLCAHADLLLGAIRPGGWLVLSGILAHEIDAVRGIFSARAEALWGAASAPDSRSDGEWADLRLLAPPQR
jgi:ribosomal protein L11 methyltransferase